ncbi:cytoplasmic tRNA 2-thiolation protein 2 [Selaginella moellendorffii]|nr:cytoplasmic tRNA 2-thiolation protein 2 [Selaginella moellendorffii]|eukprot:XP_002973588.2 cytoplasmic tRNA 2-thiolation protein 2 [Selaginella moellendorffii]
MAACSGACDGCSAGDAIGDRKLDVARSVCMKCKEEAAVALANQTEPMCAQCLRSSILGKFKTVLNTHALVSAQDRILLGFSGGPSSRVALEFLAEIRSEALASRALNAPGFGLGVVFIDEGLAIGTSREERSHAVDVVEKIVSRLELPLVVRRLEEVFDDDNQEDCSTQLKNLLDSVKDGTGKEDIVEILRMELLEQVAKKEGYTKLVLGLSTTRIAARVVSATAKGQGFALAAGVQYVDSRWHAPVVLPLRDCATKELALLCHFFHLETLFLTNFSTLVEPSASTINSLCSNFVFTLREDNSSRDHTIVRTAGKLTPFSFNHLAPSNGDSRSMRKRRGVKTELSNSGSNMEALCVLCRAPVDGRSQLEDDPRYCRSCTLQIVDDSKVCNLLPRHIQARRAGQAWMKSKIEEFLL